MKANDNLEQSIELIAFSVGQSIQVDLMLLVFA